jgi:3-hydroxybutyrate dehydrogenase
MPSLEGKLVFVTGGTGSIGQALIEAFHAAGATVHFQYCSATDVATSLQARLGVIGIPLDFNASFFPPDLPVDILVNNAAVNSSLTITHDVSPALWDMTIAVNLTAPFLLSRAYLPHMATRGWGRIMNISSIYGLRANEGLLPYNASKHGLAGLTRTVAREYGAKGITCNEICPGPVESNMLIRLGSLRAAANGLTYEQYLSEILSETPNRRLATPADVASLALFLSSNEASHINGVSLPLDGGLVA